MHVLSSVLSWLNFSPFHSINVPSCPRDAISCPILKEPVITDPNSAGCCIPSPYGVQVLALQWLPSMGITEETLNVFRKRDDDEAKNKLKSLDLVARDSFTMHGTWPGSCSQVHGGGGSRPPMDGCDARRSLSRKTKLGNLIYEKNRDLYGNMTKYWPSMKGGMRQNSFFWLHEWNKHGTCLSTIHPNCGVYNHKNHEDVRAYFEFGLKGLRRFPLLQLLENAGIKPNSKAPVSKSAVISALRDGLATLELGQSFDGSWKLRMDFICTRHPKTKQQALSEVRLFTRVNTRGDFKVLMPSVKTDIDISSVYADVRGDCGSSFFIPSW